MPRGDGTGPQGLGPGTGRRKGRRTWLDKKLSQKKEKDKSEQDESN